MFSLKLDDSARAFETLVFFSWPKRFLHSRPEIIVKKWEKGCRISLPVLPTFAAEMSGDVSTVIGLVAPEGGAPAGITGSNE